MVNRVLGVGVGVGVGFGLFHPLRKVVHMGSPREWATKLVGAAGPCGQLSDHLFLDSDPEYLRHPLLQLLLLRADLNWQHAFNSRNLVDCLLALEGFQGHSDLELRTEYPSFSFHSSLDFITQRIRSHLVYPLAPFKGTTSIQNEDYSRLSAYINEQHKQNIDIQPQDKALRTLGERAAIRQLALAIAVANGEPEAIKKTKQLAGSKNITEQDIAKNAMRWLYLHGTPNAPKPDPLLYGTRVVPFERFVTDVSSDISSGDEKGRSHLFHMLSGISK